MKTIFRRMYEGETPKIGMKVHFTFSSSFINKVPLVQYFCFKGTFTVKEPDTITDIIYTENGIPLIKIKKDNLLYNFFKELWLIEDLEV